MPSLKARYPKRLLAGGVVGLLLVAGTPPADAAEPGAPERLAAQAAGVVGSGPELSLKIREAGGDRSLKVGEVYADGWALKALTPSIATLVRDGTTLEVGLNPTGQVPSNAPAAPPSTVSMVGLPGEAEIQATLTRLGPMAAQGLAQAATLGVSNDEARRYMVYTVKIQDEVQRRLASGEITRPAPPSDAELRILLGDSAFADYAAIRAIGNPAAAAQATAADINARPISGPSSYYVPAGADAAEVALAQGVDRRGVWSVSEPDASGGVTRTRTDASAQGAAAAVAAYVASQYAASPTQSR